MPITTKVELVEQLKKLWGQLPTSEWRAEKQNLEVEELWGLLAEQKEARSSEN